MTDNEHLVDDVTHSDQCHVQGNKEARLFAGEHTLCHVVQDPISVGERQERPFQCSSGYKRERQETQRCAQVHRVAQRSGFHHLKQ